MLRCVGEVLRGLHRLSDASHVKSSLLISRAISSTAVCHSKPDSSDYDWFYSLPSWWSHQKPEADKYCRQRKLVVLGNRTPWLASDVYIAPSAVVIGDVDIYDGVCSEPSITIQVIVVPVH